MELRQLTYFVAAAEEAHFRRAARRVAITQPALSHQIARLEGELGVRLFDRSRSHVELTEPGRAFLRSARQLLGEIHDAVEQARRAATPDRTLTLGFFGYTDLPFLESAVRNLQARLPEVQLETRDLPTSDVIRGVLARRLDVGLALSPIFEPALEQRHVVTGRWSVVMPRDYVLAALDEVPLASIMNDRLIFLPRDVNPDIYDCFGCKCRDAGFVPRIAHRITQQMCALLLVTLGSGLFVIASFALNELPPELVVRPLAGSASWIKLNAVWRADNHSPVLRAFLDGIRSISEPSSDAA